MQPNLSESNIVKMTLSTIDGKRSVDIMNMFSTMQIFEEIFKPYTYGFIYVNDTVNIFNGLPVLAEEILEVTFHSQLSDTFERKYKFWVYSIQDVQIARNSLSQTYRLDFITFDQLNNAKNVINYKCTGLISDGINELTTKYLTKPLKYKPTYNNVDYLVPLNTPTDCIMFLTRRARNNDPKDADNYVFYEAQSTYVFASINQLIKQGFDNIKTRNALGQNTKFYIGSTSHLELINHVDIMNRSAVEAALVNVKDTLTGIKTGQFVNIHNIYDIATRSFINYVTDYTSTFDAVNHINSGTGYKKQSNNFVSTLSNTSPYLDIYVADSSKPDFGIISATGPVKETYSFQFFESAVVITTPGDSSINLGDVFEVMLPERTPYTPGPDSFRSNYYMIGRMVHRFEGSKYENVLTLYTDNFDSNIEEQLKATKVVK